MDLTALQLLQFSEQCGRFIGREGIEMAEKRSTTKGVL